MPEPEPAEKKTGKFAKFKSAFTKADDSGERFSSFDGHPFDRNNERFSTLRSEFLHGKVLKPVEKYLEKHDRDEAESFGLFGSIWYFRDDDEEEDS